MTQSDRVFGYPKSDSGAGKLGDYGYDLLPKSKRMTIQLAGSDSAQEELAALIDEESLQCFIAPRTADEERTDAPMPVRFLTGRRMSTVVGYVPRGLEPVVIEALARLANRSDSRIPASIIRSHGRLRVVLLMGATR